jgi:hypothetical protein
MPDNGVNLLWLYEFGDSRAARCKTPGASPSPEQPPVLLIVAGFQMVRNFPEIGIR